MPKCNINNCPKPGKLVGRIFGLEIYYCNKHQFYTEVLTMAKGKGNSGLSKKIDRYL